MDRWKSPSNVYASTSATQTKKKLIHTFSDHILRSGCYDDQY